MEISSIKELSIDVQEGDYTTADLIRKKIICENDLDTNSRNMAKKYVCLLPFYILVTHPLFNFFIFLLIIGNTVILSLDTYPLTKAEKNFFNDANEIFSYCFLCEMILKLVGLGPGNYMKDSYNRFDSIVVCCSIVELIMFKAAISSDNLAVFESFKVLRLLRIIKLARSWQALQDILKKLLNSFIDIGYFTVLVFLFTYIVALLGMEMFAYSCNFTDHGDLIVGDALLEAR